MCSGSLRLSGHSGAATGNQSCLEASGYNGHVGGSGAIGGARRNSHGDAALSGDTGSHGLRDNQLITGGDVLAGSGLVGIVTEAGPNYAQVRSIIDDASNVSAMMLSTSDTCMVRGDLELMADGRLRFEKLPNNDNVVEPGEQVVTSHVSSRFLQGLFIGYVSDIDVDANNLTRSGYITPAVDFSKLQEVLVITTTKQEMTGGGDAVEGE